MLLIGAKVDVTVPARAAAVAWLNAFSAASQEEGRPALFRTLCVEVFRAGLHFIGCDGTALFRTWVPVDDKSPEWPELDEAPEQSAVVMDTEGFGLGFVKALERLTKDDAHAYDTLVVRVDVDDDPATSFLSAELRPVRVTLVACGQSTTLRVYEGAYPEWRELRLGTEAVERVDGMTVSPRILGMLAKLKGAGSVDVEFHGAEKYIGFVATGEHEVRGLVMPMQRRRARSEG